MTEAEKQIESQEINDLKNMTEKERIKTYVSKYLSYIENLDYEKAYNLLDDDFKQNYFKTIEEFETYAKNLYPDIIIVEYEEMQRQGKYFILYLNIVDALGEKETITQKFIVYELDYNDFIVSFEVI